MKNFFDLKLLSCLTLTLISLQIPSKQSTRGEEPVDGSIYRHKNLQLVAIGYSPYGVRTQQEILRIAKSLGIPLILGGQAHRATSYLVKLEDLPNCLGKVQNLHTRAPKFVPATRLVIQYESYSSSK